MFLLSKFGLKNSGPLITLLIGLLLLADDPPILQNGLTFRYPFLGIIKLVELILRLQCPHTYVAGYAEKAATEVIYFEEESLLSSQFAF